jgi:hypothetical protein
MEMGKTRPELTQVRLRELLSYDPATGIFMWLESKQGRHMDRPAGDVQRGGRVISIDGQRYQAARLAWFYVNGELPPGYIQFENGDDQDIRIDNLRYARSRQEANKRFRDAHPESNRKANWKKFYGMTEADYMALYVAQGGVCAACQQPEIATRNGAVRWLCVDHHHGDGHIRGLLCLGCNTALGYAKDSPSILRALADYAEKDEAKRANIVPLRGKVN